MTLNLPANIEDELFCVGQRPISSLFCQQDLPDSRAYIAHLAHQQRLTCNYRAFPSAGPTVTWLQFTTNQSIPWSSLCSFKSQKESLLERSTDYSKRYPDAQISIADLVGGSHQSAFVEHCETRVPGEEMWTFERVGPFVGHGEEWHSAGWADAGKFESQGVAGIWVTAFGFSPQDAQQSPLGLPPVHIHHMHVTSSQSMAHPIKPSSDGYFAVEFDVHGDRQCPLAKGGMHCTIRAFPDRYGMKLTDSMETFFDLKDVRPRGSRELEFYAEYIFRWTKAPQRLVGKLLTGISTWSFKPHDDYLLEFNPSHPTEYLYWLENRFTTNASLVHMYWHAHHKYAEDMWVVSASPKDLNLMLFGDRYINLTAIGHDVTSAQRLILNQIRRVQHTYAPGKTFPSLRCRMNKDRWEFMEQEKQFFPRYHAPQCSQWDFRKGDEFTVLSFHKIQKEEQLLSKEQFWMHAVLYGFYVPLSGESVAMPHGMYADDLMLGGVSRPAPGTFGEHAGWWGEL